MLLHDWWQRVHCLPRVCAPGNAEAKREIITFDEGVPEIMPLDHSEVVHLVAPDRENEPARETSAVSETRGLRTLGSRSRRHDFGQLQNVLAKLVIDFAQAVLVQGRDVEIHRQRPVPAFAFTIFPVGSKKFIGVSCWGNMYTYVPR